jgi:hypothetical protein
VRKIRDSLNNPLKKYFSYFVEQEGKGYGCYKPQRRIYNAHGDGIPQGSQERLVFKQEFEPLQTYPLLAEKTSLRLKILERHCPAPKRHINKKYYVEYYGEAHEKELLLTA